MLWVVIETCRCVTPGRLWLRQTRAKPSPAPVAIGLAGKAWRRRFKSQRTLVLSESFSYIVIDWSHSIYCNNQFHNFSTIRFG